MATRRPPSKELALPPYSIGTAPTLFTKMDRPLNQAVAPAANPRDAANHLATLFPSPPIFKNHQPISGPDALCNEAFKRLYNGQFIGMKISFDERKDALTAMGITAEEFFRKELTTDQMDAERFREEYLCDFSEQP